MWDKVKGLGGTVLGYTAGAVVAGSLAGRGVPGAASAAGLVASSMLWRGKTSGLARGLLTGAGVAGGVRLLRDGLEALDRSDVLGRAESVTVAPALRFVGAARRW